MLRELHKSLIDHLTNLVKNTKDYYGNVIDITILIKHPHTDLQTESYPCITIQFLNSDENLQSTNVNSFRVLKSATPGKVDVVSEPTIYDFNFQLDVWAKDPITRDAVVGSLMNRLPKRGLITVEYSEDDKLPCRYLCSKLMATDFTNEHNEVVFRNTFDIRIQAPIFSIERVTTVQVGSVDTIINNKEDK